jgi:hypothetical protein
MTVPAESHERGRRVLRPANYAVGTPGFGAYEGELPTGQTYAVMNLQGRVFMSSCDDPFRKADSLLAEDLGEGDSARYPRRGDQREDGAGVVSGWAGDGGAGDAHACADGG